MIKILIGSTAIKHWFPDFPREPKDIDYAVNVETKSGEKGIEYLYNPVLCENTISVVLVPDLLLTLKVSHLFWDYEWNKHMFDVQFLLDKGCTIDQDLLNKLIPFWEEYLPKVRRSNLAQSKDEFFTNAVNEDVHEHDNLHLALHPTPAYIQLLKDGSEVELDEAKWYNLPYEEKCRVCTEETMVMSTERYEGKLKFRSAYLVQFKDNIIKHFPKYIALFAIKNYKKLYLPKFNYYELINTRRV